MSYPVVSIPAEYAHRYGPMRAMNGVRRVMLHCTATQESSTDLGFDWLWNVHVDQNGWSGPGYHFAIQHDGRILETRPIKYEGAGCSGQNHHTVHITYFGGLEDETLRSKDTRTAAQKEATVWLIRKLAEEHPDLDDRTDIVGHNQFAAKDCPCFNVPNWVATISLTEEQDGKDPEPGMTEIENLVQYIKDLETRVAGLERWKRDE